MGEYHASVFLSHKVEEEISNQDTDIYDDEGREGSYDSTDNEKSAKDESRVLGEREADASEYEEGKETEIGELLENGRNLHRTLSPCADRPRAETQRHHANPAFCSRFLKAES